MRKIKTETKLLTFALHKYYFDRGYGISGIIKYFVGLIGLAGSIIQKDVSLILIIGFSYALFCYLLGMFWVKYRIADAEAEIGNRINPFMREMRRNVEKILEIVKKGKK